MELRVRDVARLLKVSEQTVYRWVRNGSLPAHRVHDQYMFNRVELQEWAALHGHRVSPELLAPNGSAEELPSLHAAMQRGGIFYEIPGERREEVLEAVTQLPGIPRERRREVPVPASGRARGSCLDRRRQGHRDSASARSGRCPRRNGSLGHEARGG
jgi:PTS system nitrogen regulatory IIA component